MKRNYFCILATAALSSVTMHQAWADCSKIKTPQDLNALMSQVTNDQSRLDQAEAGRDYLAKQLSGSATRITLYRGSVATPVGNFVNFLGAMAMNEQLTAGPSVVTLLGVDAVADGKILYLDLKSDADRAKVQAKIAEAQVKIEQARDTLTAEKDRLAQCQK